MAAGPAGRRLRAAPAGRSTPRASSTASASTGSTSSATRAPGLGHVPPRIPRVPRPGRLGASAGPTGAASTRSSRSTRCRTSSSSPACRCGSAGVPLDPRPPRGDAGVLPDAASRARRARSRGALLGLQERLSIRAASAVVTVNDALARPPRRPRRAGREDHGRPNSPSLARFDPRPAAAAPFMADGTCGSCTPAPSRPTYELDVAIDAVARLVALRPDLAVRFDLYGRGDAEPALRGSAPRARARRSRSRSTAGSRSRTCRRRSPRPTSAWPRPAATRSRDFSLSTKIFEYGAMGKPVVASRLPLVERTFPPVRATYEPGDAERPGRGDPRASSTTRPSARRRVARTAVADRRAVLGARGATLRRLIERSPPDGYPQARRGGRRRADRRRPTGATVSKDPAWRSSASAMWACRSRSRSSRPASRSSGVDATAGRVDELLEPAARRSTTSTTRACAPASRAGFTVVGAGRGASAGRRRLRLRPDADHPGEGPGSRAGPARRRARPRRPPGRASWSSSSRRRSRARRPARSARRSRSPVSSPAATSTSRSPRSASTPATRRAPADRPPPRRRDDPGRRRRGRPRSCAASTTTVIELSSPDAAELAKLLENVFRNVNIALVNQLALLCERMGLDVWEVIDAAATKPFGFMRFTPGPGRRRPLHPGRSVLPLVAGPRVRLRRPLRRAGRRHQPRDAAPRRRPRRGGAQRSRPGAQGRRVGVLGVAFKPNVRDPRNSPAADVIAGLVARAAPRSLPRPARARRSALPDGRRWRRSPLESSSSRTRRRGRRHRRTGRSTGTRVFERADLVVDTTDSSRGRRSGRARSSASAPAGSPRPHASWRALSRGCGSIPSRPDTFVASRRLLAGFPDRGPTAA